MGIRVAILLAVLPLIMIGGITNNAYAGATALAGSGPGPSNLNFVLPGGSDNTLPPTTVSACNPVSSCPPIIKEFRYQSGIGPTTVSLHEQWIVGSGPEWWDWHENILTPPWIFTSVAIAKAPIGAACPVNPPPPLPRVIINNGQTVWIDFANNIGLATQGETLCIWKELNIQTTFAGSLIIEEWPTIHKNGKVGGEFIGVDATALLLANVETNALAIIGALSILGAAVFGALVISVRRKK